MHAMCNAVLAAPEMKKFADRVEKHLKTGKTMSQAMKIAANEEDVDVAQKLAGGGMAACNTAFEKFHGILKPAKK